MKKTSLVTLRISPAEKIKLELKAKNNRMSLSKFLRFKAEL